MTVPSVLLLSTAASLGHDPAEVRDTARRILEGSPFREAAPSPVQRGIERLLEIVGDLIGRALTVVGGSPATAWVIVALSALVLAAAVWRWTRGVRLETVRHDESADPTGRTAAEWLASARAAQARGDLEVALRHGYLATVAALEERGLVEPVPGRTIRELDAVLTRDHPALAPPIADIGARVERVVYGGEPPRHEDAVAAHAVHAHLPSLTGGRV